MVCATLSPSLAENPYTIFPDRGEKPQLSYVVTYEKEGSYLLLIITWSILMAIQTTLSLCTF